MWRSLRSTTCDSRSSNSGCISRHCHPRSPEPRRKSSEVAIRRHEDKPIQLPRVQQVHGVDNERGVRGVLASGVAELPHGLNRVLVKMGLPALEIGRRPTTVRPLHARYTGARDFCEKLAQNRGLSVARINQDREPSVVVRCHAVSPAVVSNVLGRNPQRVRALPARVSPCPALSD